MSLPELDPRYDDLVRELRGARPQVPAALAQRVARLSLDEPVAAPRRAVRRWRPSLVAVPAFALLVAGVGAGLFLTRDQPRQSATPRPEATQTVVQQGRTYGTAVHGAPATKKSLAQPLQALSPATTGEQDSVTAATVAPPPFRPTDIHASYRLHLKDAHALAQATQRAMRIVRGYGGYVVSAQTSEPGDGQADSTLVLRVPIGHVQQAIARLSALGEILEQNVSLRDLGAPIKQARTRAESLRAELASLEHTLATQLLSPEQRARLEGQVAVDKARLKAALIQARDLSKQARLAKIQLELTTRSDKAAVAPPKPGQAHRTLTRAWHLLGRELAFVLAALLVLSPLAVLGALAFAGRRIWRRREEARLLAKA
jgi:hypothetical protein